MATNKINCPRCGGPIRVEFSRLVPGELGITAPGIEEGTGRTVTLHVHLNDLDVRRHIPCYTGPGEGEPIPAEARAA
jgi:hypothetical protein